MLQKMRNYFISGMIIFLPLTLTVVLIIWGLTSLDSWLGNVLQPIIEDRYGEDFYFTGVYRVAFHTLCVVLLIYIIILIGMFARNFVGQKVYDIFEQMLVKLPFFRQLYPAFKEIAIFLFSRERLVSFKQVVMLEYPRKGIYSVGFLTNDAPPQVKDVIKKDLCNVFISTSPSPLTGFTVIIPRKELIFLDISIEAAFKFILSGGVVNPQAIERRSS
ncbi:MAG: DUF502 domain-containing protein [Candidatus Omnitrophica bacterium]|nr:DUF502 domain-containing protein [Candidatus Omnitrophota bacterium]MCB9719911.1 DUF502 domain-containing protein [Candidatus Omnitrophota bacterium]